MISKEDLDMSTVVEETVQALHAAKGSPGGELDAVQKNMIAQAVMPVIWHTAQAVLEQVNTLLARDAGGDDDMDGFIVPDSLEGLEGFDGPAHA